MNLIEPDIAQLVNELIDGFIDDGSCEFTTALAEPLPSSVFLRLLGLPVSELAMFLKMKDGILRPAGDDLDEVQANQRVERRRGGALLRRRPWPTGARSRRTICSACSPAPRSAGTG